MNNGKIIGTTTQTLAHPANPTVRIATTMTLPSIKDQIQPLIPQSILKQPNQYYSSFPHTTEHLTNHSTQITTTNVIFDYLLYLSINAKIDQAKIDVEGQQPSFSSYKKVQGVEAIVEGLLQSHQIQTSSLSLPLSLKHRLYLCQLLHLVFDRSHIAVSGSSFSRSRFLQYPTNISNPNPATSMPSYTLPNNQRPTTTTTTTTTVTNNHHSSQKQRVHKLPTNLAKYEKHFKNALLSRCRKHRQSICTACQQHPSNSSVTPPMSRRRSTPPKPIPTRQTAPGLIDAIPIFLNTSAITYRLANDGIDFEHDESMTVNQSWYDLLLDLLTQAAIECYLCDSYNSIDALLEIFSYGDIDPSDYHSDDSDSEDDDPHAVATRADDYLLWQRTTYLDEFRQKKKARMEEFLNVKGKFEQHFENLANKYSVRGFEAAMLNYCQRVMGCLKTPTLIEGHKTNTNYNELPREILSGRYNGGIDIPMSDEEDLEDTNDSQCESNDTDENNLKKRRLSDSDGGKFKGIKKKKSEDTINNHHHHQ